MPLSRVDPGTSTLGVAYQFAPRFLWECLTIQTMVGVPEAPHLTVREVFPHTAIRHHSRQVFAGQSRAKLYNPFLLRVTKTPGLKILLSR